MALVEEKHDERYQEGRYGNFTQRRDEPSLEPLQSLSFNGQFSGVIAGYQGVTM
jgi:hypothetical protein